MQGRGIESWKKERNELYPDKLQVIFPPVSLVPKLMLNPYMLNDLKSKSKHSHLLRNLTLQTMPLHMIFFLKCCLLKIFVSVLLTCQHQCCHHHNALSYYFLESSRCRFSPQNTHCFKESRKNYKDIKKKTRHVHAVYSTEVTNQMLHVCVEK